MLAQFIECEIIDKRVEEVEETDNEVRPSFWLRLDDKKHCKGSSDGPYAE